MFGCLYCRYIIVVEHDLSVLDYLSDYICCLYGVPGAYGVVTMPFSVREGKDLRSLPVSMGRIRGEEGGWLRPPLSSDFVQIFLR